MSEHKLAIERSVLGALLVDPERIGKVSELLDSSDFTASGHKAVFEVLLELHGAGTPIDFHTVGEALRRAGRFDMVGGAAGLDDLAQSVTSAAHVAHHAHMLAEQSDLMRARAEAGGLAACSDRAGLQRVVRKLDSIVARDGAGSHAAPLASQRLADVEPRAVEWLWPGVIPLGKLTVLVGPPGVGKSSVARDLAARITVGGAGPGGEPLELASVLYLAGEEDPGDTLRPAIDAAGGDARYVHVITDPPSMPEQADRLRAVIERLNAEGPPVRMLIVDTVADVLGRADDSKNVDVRRALQPLRQIAEDFRIAVVLVAHTRKAGGTTMAGRVMGSTAFAAFARSVVAVVRDPQAGKDGRLIAVVKSNLAEVDGRAWTVRLEGPPVRVVWTGRRQADESELLAALEPQPAQRPRDEASDFLREILAPGPVAASEVLRRAEERGIATRTIDRAKRELGVLVRKVGMLEGWTWELPTEAVSNNATVRHADEWRSSKDASLEEVARIEVRQSQAPGESGNLRTDVPQVPSEDSSAPITSAVDQAALTPSTSLEGAARADRGDEADVPAAVEDRAASEHGERARPLEPNVPPGELFGDEDTHDYNGH